MEYGLSLIDKAAEMCGKSYYRLSKEWGVAESTISQIRKGKRMIPLARVPKLAILAGVDPQEAYLRVSIEQMPEGSEERDLLGNVQATIVVALLLLCVSLAPLLPSQSYAAATNKVTKLHIVEYRRRVFGWVRRFGLSLSQLCAAMNSRFSGHEAKGLAG